jgi:hypothetical protein
MPRVADLWFPGVGRSQRLRRSHHRVSTSRRESVLGTEDAVCQICGRSILPGESVVKVAHDVMHDACLPSTKRRIEEHGGAS